MARAWNRFELLMSIATLMRCITSRCWSYTDARLGKDSIQSHTPDGDDNQPLEPIQGTELAGEEVLDGGERCRPFPNLYQNWGEPEQQPAAEWHDDRRELSHDGWLKQEAEARTDRRGEQLHD